jgi:uncharacterized protein YfbU (UPF0304 family)
MVIENNKRYDAEIANMIAEQVMREFERATLLHATQASMHEGYAILLEELDEAWGEVKRNEYTKALDEMTQVAAMAVRFIHDHVLRTGGSGDN